MTWRRLWQKAKTPSNEAREVQYSRMVGAKKRERDDEEKKEGYCLIYRVKKLEAVEGYRKCNETGNL